MLRSAQHTLGHQNLIVTAPPPHKSAFEYSISLGTLSFGGRLSYDLLSGAPDRRILRIDHADASRVWDPQKYPNWNSLIQRVNAAESNIGNIRLAKNLVLEIGGATVDPGFGITVHRFGAVPVAILPDTFTLGFKDRLFPLQIGVFPRLKASAHIHSEFTKADLLRSFELRLDLLLQSYLEDIAEDCHDLQRFASRRSVFAALKRVETTLAESVNGKLELILQALESDSPGEERKLATKVWDRYGPSVITTSLVRVYVLYFVNQLYRFLGVEDRSDRYEFRWQDTILRLKSLDKSGVDELLDPEGWREAAVIREALTKYRARASLDDLLPYLGKDSWLRKLVEFGWFVDLIRRERQDPGTPRIFLAGQHSIPATGTFKETVEAQIGTSPRKFAYFTQVNELEAGSSFESLIMARIWYCDMLIAVIPKGWNKVRADGRPPLDWIAREGEHARFLEKRPTFFLESGVTVDEVVQEFNRDFLLLADSPHRFEEVARKDSFRQELVRRVAGFFNSDVNLGDLGTGNIASIDVLISNARDALGRNLIDGFLGQFKDEDRNTIGRTLCFLSKGLSKKEIAKKLAKGEKLKVSLSNGNSSAVDEYSRQFERAWEKLRTRRLFFSGDSYGLIECPTRTSYSENLRNILATLRPELRPEEVEAKRLEILAGILPDEDHEFWCRLEA